MKSFNDIVTAELRIPAERISDALTPADVPDWDSMSYLLFIGELEKEYGISFTMDEIMNASSLGAVRTLVRGKGIDV
jgi:acyl carrier protein